MEETTIHPRSEAGHSPPRDEQGTISKGDEVRGEPDPVPLLSAALDAEVLRDEQGPIPDYPPRRYDEKGGQLPLTPEEVRLSSEIFRRTMALIDAADQDPPGSDEEFMRSIDSRRPEGMKLFKGYY